MKDLLNSLNCHTKNNVNFEIEQINEYIIFNPTELFEHFKVKKIDALIKKVKKTIDKMSENEILVKKPSGYMIGASIELNDNYEIDDLDELLKYKHIDCKDIELIIIVLCSTVGDLYIPKKPLTIDKNNFKRILFFPKNEVNS